ncbi:MAG: hypothetical protein C0597_12130 [Marinilabiliales bacterium]|nr:MAG: hypothetical protein C0597_12130 [Marinilabiliales bacterium]
MKKIFIILFTHALLVFISACGNTGKHNQQGTHTQEDGTVHNDEQHKHEEENDLPEQENFVLGEDTAEMHDHNEHDKDQDHDHVH